MKIRWEGGFLVKIEVVATQAETKAEVLESASVATDEKLDGPAPAEPEWYRMVPNGTEWYQMVPNGTECYRMVPNSTEWYRMVPNGTEWC